MGGIGSGRTGGGPTVERALKLDLAHLTAQRQFRPGAHVSGSLQWTSTRTGRVTATIGFEADMRDGGDAWVRLHYASCRDDGTKAGHDYRVRLDTTAPHLGGRRWWFRCPMTGRRARVLYLPDGASTFASRGAHGLAYASQRQTDTDNAIDRSLALRRKLGVDDRNTLRMPFAPRPKWMRRATHARLLGELHATTDFLVGGLAKRLGMETGRQPWAS